MNRETYAGNPTRRRQYQYHPDQPVAAERDYLKIIFYLNERGESASITRLAHWMQESPPRVTYILQQLERKKTITCTPAGEIVLTVNGQCLAQTIVRRQRLLECFLLNMLHIPWYLTHREAIRLEPFISPVMEERVTYLVGEVQVCPYGNPIPGYHLARRGTRQLHTVPPDMRFVITHIDEEAQTDIKLLRWFSRWGCLPQTTLVVIEKQPAHSMITRQDTRQTVIVPHQAAAFVWGDIVEEGETDDYCRQSDFCGPGVRRSI